MEPQRLNWNDELANMHGIISGSQTRWWMQWTWKILDLVIFKILFL